jgi:hypothetical protein
VVFVVKSPGEKITRPLPLSLYRRSIVLRLIVRPGCTIGTTAVADGIADLLAASPLQG